MKNSPHWIIAACLGTLLVESQVLSAAELLSNGSFDTTASWTVVPPHTDWTCIANGEALLHPSTEGYIGTVIRQQLSARITSSRTVKLSAVLSKPGAPSGFTIVFRLTYLDSASMSHEVDILSPSNDTITTLTPLSKSITLPADAAVITGLSVYKNGFGTFTLQSVSLDLPFSPPMPEIVVKNPNDTEIKDGGKFNFGKVIVNTKSQTKIFTIQNIGKARLKNLEIKKNGKHANAFSVTHLQTSSIAAGNSAKFKVTFQPGGTGVRNAAIHIKSNDSDENPYDINLTGSGAEP